MKRKVCIVVMLLSLAACLGGLTIHSTPTGGNWTDPNSWIEHIVPDSTMDVEISSIINVVGTPFCRSISVFTSGTLQTNGSTRTLTVIGNLSNQGNIANISSAFYISLKGDLAHLAGTFAPYSVTFIGSATQTITQSVSVAFNCFFQNSKPSGNIVLGSNCIFSDKSFNLGSHTLSFAGYKMSNALLSAGTITGGGNSVIENGNMASVTVNDSIQVNGVVNITDNSVVFNDLVTVNGTLRTNGISLTLTINGSLINRGIITNISSAFYITLKGNLTHLAGAFTPYIVTFIGSANQIISQSDSVAFNCYFQNSKTAGSIVLGSDCKFSDKSFGLNAIPISLSGFKITNAILSAGTIMGGGTSAISNCSLSSVQVLESVQLYEIVNIIDSAVVFNGAVTVFGTLRNSGGSYHVTIVGNLVNYGNVMYNSSAFYVNVKGDVLHADGIFTPNHLIFTGEGNQVISQADSVVFNCPISNSKPTGNLSLGSDLFCAGNTILLNQKSLNLVGYKLTNSVLTNGTVNAGSTSKIEAATLSTITVNNSIQLYDIVNIADGAVVFNGAVTVFGTLRNSGGSYHVTIVGNLVNYGNVMYNSSAFYVNVKGDVLHADGIFTPNHLIFTGEGNQVISQADSVVFNCPISNSKPTGNLSLGSDLFCVGNTIQLNQKSLYLAGYKLTNSVITNGIINAGSTSTIETATLSSLTVNDGILFFGIVNISDGAVVFNGAVTVNGTLRNSGGSFSVSIVGNLVNHGTITSNSSSLSLFLMGNLTNNGTINIYRLYHSGIGQRTINFAASPTATFSVNYTEIQGSNFEFIGTNVMPAFTILGTSVCRIGTGASLSLPIVDSGIIGAYTNLGKVSLNRSVSNTADKTFYKATVKPNADYDAKVSSLVVETNCYSIPPYFQEGGLKAWWNLIPTTTSTNLSLNQLILYYNQDMLNTENESTLELVHSYDCVSWAKINTITVDTLNNKVTIPNAPGRGYFAFTSTVQISGRVVGWDNPSLGLSGAKVSLGDEFTDSVTNASGNWTLNVPPYQSCAVTFSHTSYNPIVQIVRVWTTNLNIGDVVLPEKLGSPSGFTATQNALGSVTQLSWSLATRFEDDLSAASTPADRVFSNYSVYRLLFGEEYNRPLWTLLSTQSGTGYTDAAWANVPFGVYRYALIANYSSGLCSLPVFTDQIIRRNFSVAESFDAPTLPSGWTVQHTGSTASPWSPTLESGTDYQMQVANTPSNTASERLISAQYNCTRYTKVFVSFWHHYVPNTNSQAVLQVSTNGVQWNIINNYAAVADSGFKNYDISTYAANNANVRFRWAYTATSSATNFWKLDDFSIYGYTPIPVYLADPYPAPGNSNCNSRTVSLGIKVIDDELVDATSLQYRIDANGNGTYDAGENWIPISGYTNAQMLVLRVNALYAADGNNLKYEFKANDVAANGIKHSGSEHLSGISDDYSVNIKTTLPPTITGLVATSISTNSASIAWNPISDPQFLRYELYLSKNETVDLFDVCLLPLDFPALGVMSTSTITLTELEQDRYYWLAMRAVDTFGNVSPLSVTALLTPISFPPAFSAATPLSQPDPGWSTTRLVNIGCIVADHYGVNTATLSYRYDANGNGSYDSAEAWQAVPPANILRNSNASKTTQPLSSSAAYRDPIAQLQILLPVTYACDGNDLRFEFKADDINGYTGYSGMTGANGILDDWKVRIDTVTPAAIANLSFVCIADSAVELSWNASSDQFFKSYEVYYGTHDNISIADSLWNYHDDAALGQAGSGFISTQITGLVPHNLYRFRVRATDLAGNSTLLTNEVMAYFGEMLPPLQPVAIDIASSGQDLMLSWSPVNSDVEGNPLTVDWYNLYIGFTPDFTIDDEHYLDTCLGNAYTHYDMLSYGFNTVFYKVTAEYGLGINTRSRIPQALPGYQRLNGLRNKDLHQPTR